MNGKGQASLEALAWLSVAAVGALASAILFGKGFGLVSDARAEFGVEDFASGFSSAVESLGEGSVRHVSLTLPEGLSNVTIASRDNGGSMLSFTFRGTVFARPLAGRVVVAYPSPFGCKGERWVRVEKRQGVVFVSGAGGADDCA